MEQWFCDTYKNVKTSSIPRGKLHARFLETNPCRSFAFAWKPANHKIQQEIKAVFGANAKQQAPCVLFLRSLEKSIRRGADFLTRNPPPQGSQWCGSSRTTGTPGGGRVFFAENPPPPGVTVVRNPGGGASASLGGPRFPPAA